MRQHFIVLMASLWEKYRPLLQREGHSGNSDFWGSIARIRNSVLHNKGLLRERLYDQETFDFLRIGEPIVISNDHLGAVFVKAHSEVTALFLG